MIIPGPNSPTKETIDVFLQPLVHDLKKLWVGEGVDKAEPPGRQSLLRINGLSLILLDVPPLPSTRCTQTVMLE